MDVDEMVQARFEKLADAEHEHLEAVKDELARYGLDLDKRPYLRLMLNHWATAHAELELFLKGGV